MTRWRLAALLLALALASALAVGWLRAPRATANQVLISYVEPANPALAPIHARLVKRKVLEELREFLAPLKLPKPLSLRTAGCGVQNAEYNQATQTITICYELVGWLHSLMPADTSQYDLTREELVVGAFVDIVLHEAAHAVFHLLGIPVFGREEDAADQLAALILLQFDERTVRRTIIGAALLFDSYAARNREARAKGSHSLAGVEDADARRTEFAGVHGLPEQRYFNLLCIAYGRHRSLFAEFVDKGTLPPGRAQGCAQEYRQVADAYRKLIEPHVDPVLRDAVLKRTWIPPRSEK